MHFQLDPTHSPLLGVEHRVGVSLERSSKKAVVTVDCRIGLLRVDVPTGGGSGGGGSLGGSGGGAEARRGVVDGERYGYDGPAVGGGAGQ